MDDEATTGLSRRTMIKRVGAGAAVAWAAPAIVTTTRASAAVASPLPSCGKGAPCDIHVDCGPGGAGCACFILAEGGQFCSAGEFGCNGTVLCTTSNDCPGNWGCVVSCCGQAECRPPCGEPNTAAAGETGSSKA